MNEIFAGEESSITRRTFGHHSHKKNPSIDNTKNNPYIGQKTDFSRGRI